MKGLMERTKRLLPESVLKRLSRYYSWIQYREYDTSDGWRKKASKDGWQAIYWHNEHYNRCFDAAQKRYLQFFLDRHQIGFEDPVLDIGCGIGRLCKFFSDLGYQRVTGVDFPEMVEKAKTENDSDCITYIASPAQDFLRDERFRFIISSSCFGVIRRRDFMFRAIENCTRMQRAGDVLLMIDPFHKNNYLATSRARISGADIVAFVEERGYRLVEKSGMLFFPVKRLIEDKWDMNEKTVVRMFTFGERVMRVFSNYYLSDYKILGFEKVD